jgi:ABC-type dipeptide/oligopeptide/nickel transport system ATPase component
VLLNGVDVMSMSDAELRNIWGPEVAMVFQDPLGSLNPVMRIGQQVAEGLRVHHGVSKKEARSSALSLLRSVGIPSPEARIDDYPHQLSGGMRQRVVIAIALACGPKLLIADEPTTALDVTIQAQILGLMRELQDRTDAGVIIITHDMGVVAEVADDVVVMNRSKLVERGSVYDIFEQPQEPYTKSLLAAVPKLGSMEGTSEPARFDLVGEQP